MAQKVVSMRAQRFDPKDLHIVSGDQIVWKNEEAEGGTQHTATSDDGTTFDTKFINAQQSSAPYTITGKPGTIITYTCQVHPAHMKGTVIIDQ
jgi:plastocyanin